MPRKPTNAVHRHFEWGEDLYSTCKICGNKLKGNHATNLMNHLRLKHQAQFKEVDQLNKVAVKVTPKQRTNEDEKGKKLKILLNSCIKLITVHGRPFELLDDEAFRDIKSLILPEFKHEGSSKKVKDMIIDKSYEIKVKIANELNKKMISLKLDSATCMERQFIGINVQYIKNSKIVSRTLALQEIFSRQTAEDLKLIVTDVLGDFHIDLNNIYSVTTDNGSNYLKITALFNEELTNTDTAEENNSEETPDDYYNNLVIDSLDASILSNDTNETFKITSIRCAAHTLQLCIKDAINVNPDIDSIINSCRSVVNILRRPLFKIKIRLQNMKKPIIDCSTRWASTYNMLRRLKELKPICDESEEICEILSEHFWLETNNIIECLQPAAEATIRLQAEQLTLSDFYAIWLICKTKTEMLNFSLARDIVTSMAHREKLLLENKTFLAAIFLDPRWKCILSEFDLEVAKSWIKEVYRQMCQVTSQGLSDTSVDSQDTSVETVVEASTSSGLVTLADTSNFHSDLQCLELILEETQRVRQLSSNTLTLDFEYYLAEYATVSRLAITENVIRYWTQKLPNKLAEVALIILAAPATQVTVERLFSTLKFILTPSRNRLLDQTIKVLLISKVTSTCLTIEIKILF